MRTCTDCGRPMRYSHQLLADAPGTILHGAQGRCTQCHRRANGLRSSRSTPCIRCGRGITARPDRPCVCQDCRDVIADLGELGRWVA